jgi:hypothetical protein
MISPVGAPPEAEKLKEAAPAQEIVLAGFPPQPHFFAALLSSGKTRIWRPPPELRLQGGDPIGDHLLRDVALLGWNTAV